MARADDPRAHQHLVGPLVDDEAGRRGSWLDINAGRYKIQEISIWQMARQPYQIIDDMFRATRRRRASRRSSSTSTAPSPSLVRRSAAIAARGRHR